jgi:hypothetical protein
MPPNTFNFSRVITMLSDFCLPLFASSQYQNQQPLSFGSLITCSLVFNLKVGDGFISLALSTTTQT